jgi:Tfp pilus assembly protein PilE
VGVVEAVVVVVVVVVLVFVVSMSKSAGTVKARRLAVCASLHHKSRHEQS